jgi:hypothetical protein
MPSQVQHVRAISELGGLESQCDGRVLAGGR